MAVSSMFCNSRLSVLFIILGNLVYCCYGGSHHPTCGPYHPAHAVPLVPEDVDYMQFPLNIEYLEAEFYLWAALGYGLDKIAPKLAMAGPPPIGVMKANLDNLTLGIITEFGYQEIGHVRAIKQTVGGFPRPLLNLGSHNFAKLMDEAFEHPLNPPSDPYRNSINFMLASYYIPYVGLTGYVGTNPFLIGYKAKALLAGLEGVEGGQDAVIRTYLYERAQEVVEPYNITVEEFTTRISKLRNELGKCGIKDEGVFVPPELGADNRTSSNVLSANYLSLSYPRTPNEVLRILYNTGNEHIPGGFFPKGAKGRIARELLKNPS